MAHKYALQANASSTDDFSFLSHNLANLGGNQSLITLSDGSLVGMFYDDNAAAASKFVLRHTSDRVNWTQIATFGLDFDGFSYNVSICRDNLDNIYVGGINYSFSGESYAYFGLVKGAGYSWTRQTKTAHTSATNTANNVSFQMEWCNTGGGTNDKGHLMVMAGGTSYHTTHIIDAGKVLTGDSTSLSTFGGWNNSYMPGATANFMQFSPDGFGATSGIAVGASTNNNMAIGRWGVSSAGLLSINTNIQGFVNMPVFGTTNAWTNGRGRLLRVDSDRWVIIVGYGPPASRFVVARVSSTAVLTAFTEITGVTGLNGAMVQGMWTASADPITPNKIWVLTASASPSQTVHRFAINVASGIAADAAVTVHDSAFGHVSGPKTHWRSVLQPSAPFIDYQVWENYATTSYPVLGDYVVFAPPTPTAVTPTAGSTVNSDVPTLGLTLAAHGANTKGEWQLATDAGFTLNVRTVTEADADLRASGATTEVIPNASQLYQTTWHIRGRAVTAGGVQASGWTASHTFTVSHPPSTTGHFPTGSQYIAFTGGVHRLSWAFSDTSPVDHQTAYQVVVERNSDGMILGDTGKVVSGNFYHDTASILAAHKDVLLRWRVRVWDSDDVVGSYSPYQLFYVGDASTVAINVPADNGFTQSAVPFASWSFAGPGGRTQVNRRLEVIRVSDSAVVYDSGIVAGATASLTGTGFPVLVNGETYDARVTVVDSGGMSAQDTNRFTASWAPPAVPAFTIDTSAYSTLGYVRISWNHAPADADWVAWRVYRREVMEQVAGSIALPGASGGAVTTPDHADYNNALDLDFRFCLAPNDWTPATIQTLGAQWGAAGQRAWIVRLQANGAFQVLLSTDGTNTATTLASPTTPGSGFPDGTPRHVRITRVAATGVITWFWSIDGITWTQFHQATGVTGALFNSNSTLSVGAHSANSSTEPLTGRVYSAEFRYGGTLRAEFQASRFAVGAVATATMVDSLGRTWTLGAGTQAMPQDAGAWDLLDERLVQAASYSFDDYLTPSTQMVEYAVVQVANRFGVLMESG